MASPRDQTVKTYLALDFGSNIRHETFATGRIEVEDTTSFLSVKKKRFQCCLNLVSDAAAIQ